MEEFWVRWCWVGFFALIALSMVILPRRLWYVAPVGRVRGLDASQAARLRAAVVRREQLEAGSRPPFPMWIAAAALLAAALCALTRISPPLLYSLLNVVIAVSMATGYFRLRAAGTRRIASLRARDRSAIFPPWMLATTTIAVFSPLAFIDVVPLASILVTTAGLTIAVVAVRALDLPALLSGEDPPVDAYVDDQVRKSRAMMLVGAATSSASLFNLFTLVIAPGVPTASSFVWLHVLAALAASGAAFAEGMWQAMTSGRAGMDAERWSRLGV